ncbi:TPA: hypothetical protein JD836_14455 [Citrobacter freundii]|nr:hypothetical protein [Citrobacter freundii]HCD1267998.1 hypothetical protein [Citrobacter freundii]
MNKVTPEQIRNAMFSSLEDYQEAVVDSLEFDLERKLTIEEISAVYKRVDDVVTAGFKHD